MLILVVDDTEDLRLLQRVILEADGYEVVEAENGLKALEAVRRQRPDLIVSDILMPEMDGFAFCRELRANPELGSIPFMFYSATYTDKRDEEFALSVGADRFLVKPVEPLDYLAAVTELANSFADQSKVATTTIEDEDQFLREHNVTLIRKLEYKVAELQAANRAMEKEMQERKGAEQLLSQSQANLVKVQEVARLGSWDWDVTTNELYWSDEIYRISGLDPQKVAATYDVFLGSIHPDDRQSVKSSMKAAFKGEAPFDIEHRIVLPEGRVRIVHEQAEVYRNDDGKPVRMVGTVQDITERRDAEEKLVRMATAVENAAESIILADIDGVIQYVNPAFEVHTGYSPSEVIGKKPSLLKSGKHDRAFYEEMWRTLCAGGIWRARVTNKRKDSELVVEDTTTSPVHDAAGKIIGYVCLQRDVTAHVQLEKQLVQAQKLEAIGTLAGGIAHDFNNILTAVLGYAELAANDLPEDSPVQESLQHIRDAGVRATDLVDKIRTFSRQTEQEPKPFRVQPLIEEAIALLRGSLPSSIEIAVHLDASCGAIMADATQLHQVIMNLGTNACHAMQEKGGLLEVRLDGVEILNSLDSKSWGVPLGRYARLMVSDTGCGMDEATKARIFEPYFTTKKAGGGTGLGMATVHGIVKSHNGHISVYSEPDEGTIFSIYLPLCQQQAEVKTHQKKPTLPTGSERVLVVDDEAMIAELLEAILKSLGYEVTALTDSVEALEMISADPDRFDIVITDMTMPHLTGVELAERILGMRPDIPILVCTGFSEKASKEKAGEVGIKEYLMKPVQKEALANALRRYLD